jgi:hypothetical protein
MTATREVPLHKRPGCLAGVARALVTLVVLGGLFFWVVDWVFAPWIYTVGGKTRLLPLWQGVAVVDAPSGRYRIYVSFSPTPNGPHTLPGMRVQGTGYVCGPDGRRYSAQVRGGADGRIWRDMNNHPFSLDVYNRPLNYNFVDHRDWRPYLEFNGAWSGANLRMTDNGSLADAFRADGSLNTASRGARDKTRAVPVTFIETNWWLPQACPRRGA